MMFYYFLPLLFSLSLQAQVLSSPVVKIKGEGLPPEKTESIAKDLGIAIGSSLDPKRIDEGIHAVFDRAEVQRLSVLARETERGLVITLRAERLRRIRQITFHNIDSSVLSEVRNRFKIDEGDVADSFVFQKLKDRIQTIYEDKGYLFADVDIKMVDVPNTNEADVDVTVQPHDPTLVNRVLLMGINDEDQGPLKQILPLQKGKPYSRKLMEDSSDKIQNYLRDNQYPTAKVEDAVPQFSADRLSVDVTFTVKIGDKYQFVIEGNSVFSEAELRELFTEELLHQSDGLQKIAAAIESKYKTVGYHFCSVRVKSSMLEDGRLHLVSFFVEEGPKVLIDAVEITGAAKWAESDFRKFFYEEGQGVLARGVFYQGGLSATEEEIKKRFDRMGYTRVSIGGPRINFTDDKRGVRLSYDLDLGNQSIVSEIEEEGLDVIPKDEKEKLYSIRVGDPFNREEVDATRTKIQQYLLEKGYLDAEWSPEKEHVRFSPDGKRAALIFQMNPGRQYRVGKIEIEGTRRTNPEVIRREIVLKTGDNLDPKKMRQSGDNLSLLGIFSRSEVTPVQDPNDPNVKDLKIEVREAKPGVGEVGLGINYEEPLFRIKPFTSLQYRNLWGLDHTASLRGELPVPISTAPGNAIPFYEYGLVFGYRAPHPFDLGITSNSELSFENYELAYGDLSQYGVTGGASAGIPSFMLMRRARLESKIEKKLGFATPYARLYRIEAVSLTTLIQGTTPQSERIGSVGGGVILDFRDDTFNPTFGTYHVLDLELAHSILASEFSYYMATSRNSIYIPLPHPFKLSLFAGGGYARTIDGSAYLPKTRLLSDLALGGPSSLRGYNLNSIVPASYDINYKGPSETAFLNGRAELGIYLFSNISMALFADIGKVYPNVPLPVSDPSNPPLLEGHAAGIGFRYKTPVGPVSFDFAEALPAVKVKDPKTGQLSDLGLQFYFTVGTL